MKLVNYFLLFCRTTVVSILYIIKILLNNYREHYISFVKFKSFNDKNW